MKIVRIDKSTEHDRSWSVETDVDVTLARAAAVIVAVVAAAVLWKLGFPGWRWVLRVA